MTYKIGDWILVTDCDYRVDVTKDKAYEIVRVMVTSIEIIDDAHDTHAINVSCVKLTQGTCLRPNTRAFKAQYGTLAQATEAVQAVDEEDTYDTRKANASVTSAGLFSVGTRLIYEDGTPTLTSLTVKRCTATSVWFEETYSTPFNPTEFITER